MNIKIVLRVSENTTAFHLAGAWYPEWPNAQSLDHFYRSDEYWRCNICWSFYSSNYLMGTWRI